MKHSPAPEKPAPPRTDPQVKKTVTSILMTVAIRAVVLWIHSGRTRMSVDFLHDPELRKVWEEALAKLDKYLVKERI